MTTALPNATVERDFCAAQQGDRAAFTRLVAATQRMVTSVALALTADLVASEDIAQDAFLAAWQRLGRVRNPASFLPWLRQLARNRAIDHLRQRRRRRDSEVDGDELAAQAVDQGAGPVEALRTQQDADLLAQALEDIPADSREVLLLFYREGQRLRHVAVLLGLSEVAVRRRLQRARDSLRADYLQRLGEAAERSAPRAAFTVLVSSALALHSAPSAAAGFGVAALLKSACKALLAGAGSLLASVGIVVVAVFWEMRIYLRRTSDPQARRALRHNGVVYAALMATYMLLLWRSAEAGWERWQVLAAAAGFSVGIVLLAWGRARLVSRRR